MQNEHFSIESRFNGWNQFYNADNSFISFMNTTTHGNSHNGITHNFESKIAKYIEDGQKLDQKIIRKKRCPIFLPFSNICKHAQTCM